MITMNRSLLAALPLLSLACSSVPSSDYTVMIDPAFTADQQQAVISAVDAWQTALSAAGLPGHLTAVIESGCSPCSNTIQIFPVTASFLQAETPGIVGLTTYDQAGSNESFIADSIDGWDSSAHNFYWTTLHELGHGMKLVHASSGVMCKDATCSVPYVTCADLTQWGDLRGMTANCGN
jgi:hypothetical protein